MFNSTTKRTVRVGLLLEWATRLGHRRPPRGWSRPRERNGPAGPASLGTRITPMGSRR